MSTAVTIDKGAKYDVLGENATQNAKNNAPRDQQLPSTNVSSSMTDNYCASVFIACLSPWRYLMARSPCQEVGIVCPQLSCRKNSTKRTDGWISSKRIQRIQAYGHVDVVGREAVGSTTQDIAAGVGSRDTARQQPIAAPEYSMFVTHCCISATLVLHVSRGP